MKDIKVLGTGCANCRTTIALIEQIAQAQGVAVKLQKVEELRDIMGYGVMSTPGVVIDGKVVHAGGVPGRDKIERWLAAAPVAGACCDSTPAPVTRPCCGPAAVTVATSASPTSGAGRP
ncbi:MAG: thioredoxin family protein [Betaproteobacteria bacterium]|nr:thioredoxin family protein [Betaproteobacteria bacterium]